MYSYGKQSEQEKNLAVTGGGGGSVTAEIPFTFKNS